MILRVQLLKIKLSRFIRTVRDDVKNIFTKKKKSAGVEDIFNPAEEEVVAPETKETTKKKLKSSLFMAAAGFAMGVVHASAASAKYSIALTRNALVAHGIVAGLAVAGIWYGYVDASKEEMSVEDIEMTMEVVASAATGVSFEIDEDEFRMLDIAHTLVTGDTEDLEVLRDKGEVFTFDDFNEYNSERMLRKAERRLIPEEEREKTRAPKEVKRSDVDPKKDAFTEGDIEEAEALAAIPIDEDYLDDEEILQKKKKKKVGNKRPPKFGGPQYDPIDDDEDLFVIANTKPNNMGGFNKPKKIIHRTPVRNKPGSRLPDFDADTGPRIGFRDSKGFEI